MPTTTPQPAPVNPEAIRAEAEKAEWMHDDIVDACLHECRYPFGSLAHQMFKDAFVRARQLRLGATGQPGSKGATA